MLLPIVGVGIQLSVPDHADWPKEGTFRDDFILFLGNAQFEIAVNNSNQPNPKWLPHAIIICHGSYHTPIPYQPFIIALQTQGIEAYCPQLPTSDLRKLNVGIQESSTLSQPNFDRPPPSGGYPQPADDALVINELLDRLIEEEGKNVILLGHSAGGFVATYSARRKYQRKVRQASNLPGGLVGIFYVCAFMIPVGESVHSFFQPKDGPGIVPPYCQFHGNGFEGIASTVNAAQYFFSGLPEEKAKYYESTMTASPVPTTVLDNDAYTELPCAYVIADSDLALPAAFQEAMVKMQSQRTGVHVKVFRCDAGHSPHLTWTDGLVRFVQSWAESLV